MKYELLGLYYTYVIFFKNLIYLRRFLPLSLLLKI